VADPPLPDAGAGAGAWDGAAVAAGAQATAASAAAPAASSPMNWRRAVFDSLFEELLMGGTGRLVAAAW